jgi:SsrA-binding protein
MPAETKAEIKPIATNRKAFADYDFEETFEAGLSLMGSEVKSLRNGSCNLRDGFVEERGGELWLLQVHISEYKQATVWGHEPLRPRKLLLHRKEIAKLAEKVRIKGYTIVPTKLYWKGGRAKLEIALGKGRKQYDKRQAIAERENKIQMQRIIKNRGQDE